MSVGEYLIIFAAILIGLAVADLALSIHRLLRAGRTIKWHPIVPFVALIALCLILNLWWGLYRGYSATDQITFVAFLPQVLMMLSLFLMTAAVLPDEKLPEGASLKEYYLDSRGQIWGLLACYLALVIVNVAIDGVQEGWSVSQQLRRATGNFVGIVLCFALIRSERMWLHWLVVLFFLSITWLSWASSTIATPGAM